MLPFDVITWCPAKGRHQDKKDNKNVSNFRQINVELVVFSKSQKEWHK